MSRVRERGEMEREPKKCLFKSNKGSELNLVLISDFLINMEMKIKKSQPNLIQKCTLQKINK